MTPAVAERGSHRSSWAIRLLHLLASGAIVGSLLVLRPTVPDFGPSITTPLTTSTLVQLALLMLWIVCLLLALVLLRGALVPMRVRRPPPTWALGALRRPPRAPQLVRREAPAPRLLVVAPKPGDDAEPVPDRSGSAEAPTGDAPAIVARVALLGPVQIEGVRRPRRATTVELLAYLALHEEGASRDQLLEAMWPSEDPRRTRPRLWQSVSEARRLLGDAFERHGDRYKLDRMRVDVDAVQLEQLLARLDVARPAGDTEAIVHQALALWRGNPLDGTDYAWADAHRRQLEATLSKLARAAARARLDAGDAHAALQVAEQGLDSDDLDETLVRVALEAEAALGRREAVTERYEALHKRLDDRLGLEPERATRVLYRELLGQRV